MGLCQTTFSTPYKGTEYISFAQTPAFSLSGTKSEGFKAEKTLNYGGQKDICMTLLAVRFVPHKRSLSAPNNLETLTSPQL